MLPVSGCFHGGADKHAGSSMAVAGRRSSQRPLAGLTLTPLREQAPNLSLIYPISRHHGPNDGIGEDLADTWLLVLRPQTTRASKGHGGYIRKWCQDVAAAPLIPTGRR